MYIVCEWTLCVCVIRMELCNVKMFQISSLEPALVTRVWSRRNWCYWKGVIQPQIVDGPVDVCFGWLPGVT